jgi:glutathione S-transferase
VESAVETTARRAAKHHEATLFRSLDRVEAALAECTTAADDRAHAFAERDLRAAFDEHEQACRALVAELKAMPARDAFDPLRALEVDVRHVDLFGLRTEVA